MHKSDNFASQLEVKIHRYERAHTPLEPTSSQAQALALAAT